MKMNNKKWYNNEKDLATNPIFNVIWFGIWMVVLIIGIKGTIVWESYLLRFFSILMLVLQQYWYLEILELHNKRRTKQEKKK